MSFKIDIHIYIHYIQKIGMLSLLTKIVVHILLLKKVIIAEAFKKILVYTFRKIIILKKNFLY